MALTFGIANACTCMLFVFFIASVTISGLAMHDTLRVKDKDFSNHVLCQFKFNNVDIVLQPSQSAADAEKVILAAQPPLTTTGPDLTKYANRASLATSLAEMRRISKTIVSNFEKGVIAFLAISCISMFFTACVFVVGMFKSQYLRKLGWVMVVFGVLAFGGACIGIYYASSGLANWKNLTTDIFKEIETKCVTANDLTTSTTVITTNVLVTQRIAGGITMTTPTKDPFAPDFHLLYRYLLVDSIVGQAIPLIATVFVGLYLIMYVPSNGSDTSTENGTEMVQQSGYEWSRGSQAQQQVPLQSVHTVTAVDNIKLALAAGHGYQ